MENIQIENIKLEFDIRRAQFKEEDMLKGVSDKIVEIIEGWGFRVTDLLEIKSDTYEQKIFKWKVNARVGRKH
jgi:hypothetical protein